MSITIGSYVAGEVPEPLEYSFLDADGDPLDLTGFTVTFRLSFDGAAGVESSADLSATPTDGTVTYAWAAGDLVAGALGAEFEATDGTNTYISDRLVGTVARAIEVSA